MSIQADGCDLKAEVSIRNGDVHLRLSDTKSGEVWADEPYLYSVQVAGQPTTRGLVDAKLVREDNGGVITGTLSGTSIEVTHRLTASAENKVTEQLQLTNKASQPLEFTSMAFGLQSSISSSDTLRLVACPFRRQADGKMHDYSSDDLIARRFSNSNGHNDSAVTDNGVCDNDVLRSEAWILTRQNRSLLVAKYNSENIECSVASVEKTSTGTTLRFAGAGLSLFKEPRPVTLLKPGQQFTFGSTYLRPVKGGWQAGYDEYRNFLNARGHGFPSDYSPPLNWNELFDVGWYHSDVEQLAKHYTRDALMAEAAKAKEIGCDLLYLDPGWEICEGTTLWDEKRLGPAEKFSQEIKERFGLKLGYRTIGRAYRDEFPDSWYLKRENTTGTYTQPWLKKPVQAEPVPMATADMRRNLCLAPDTTVTASSVIPSHPDFHRAENLIDGWYNNGASWVSAEEPSWVEVDFGKEYTISALALGSEHTITHGDRAITSFDVKVASPDSASPGSWKVVHSYKGDPIHGTRMFQFEAVKTNKVRLEIHAAVGDTARIDELEIYQATASSGDWPTRERGPQPEVTSGTQINFWEVCTLSPEWQAEKIKRILEVTKAGVDFMMYDEFDWRGACHNAAHGHPVPSTPEGHVKAVYSLVEKMRDKFPHVLVEAHDPVWPWTSRYLPTYYRQSFSGNRYQENWGFEFMWHPIDDLKSGRAMCLYYYNLGCDIPLYDHITMESDNDSCLSFWWYASTIRHLGIGGKKGLNSAKENPVRWEAYKKAVAEYNRLRVCYARGRFVGVEETAHLHVHPTDSSAVLNVYNLTDKAQKRDVRIDTQATGLGDPANLTVSGAKSRVEAGHLILEFELPKETPALAEIRKK